MTDGREPERTGSATAPPAEQTSAAGGETSAPATQPPAGRAQSIDSAVTRILEFESNSALVATIALAIAIGIFHSNFLAWTEIKNVPQQSVYVGILAAGMAFLISMREIDLSVGSMFSLTVIGSGLLMSHGMYPMLAALIGILIGAGCGLLNAVLVQGIAIPTIVATLATLNMFRGLAIALANGQQVTGVPTGSSFFTMWSSRTTRATASIS